MVQLRKCKLLICKTLMNFFKKNNMLIYILISLQESNRSSYKVMTIFH